jgi:hypothetical protein
VTNLILPLSVNISEIQSLGKRYPWPCPPRCPRCGSTRLWGHGYVSRFFDGIEGQVWIKRWRCPDCTAVHTCRPHTFWRRFLAPVALILRSLSGKRAGQPWNKDVSRQRQQYWQQGYSIQSRFEGLPAQTPDSLFAGGLIAATHSLTDRAFSAPPEPPYPRLASTGPPIRDDSGRMEDFHEQRTT